MARIIKGRQMTARYYKGREVLKEYKGGRLVYEKATSIPDYLCFTALEAGQFTLTIPAAVTPTYLSYIEWSKDGRTWNHRDNSSDIETIDVQVASGEKVYWRGSGICMTKQNANDDYNSLFSSDARFDASGHIMSLLKGGDFMSFQHLDRRETDVVNVTFTNLFARCDTIINAKDLVLPTFTNAYTYIFYRMFFECSNLVSAPLLPNLITAQYCYGSMLRGTAITTAPELPATTLETSCYSSMFYGCPNLTTASALPATTLAYNCYGFMYSICPMLEKNIPELPAPILVERCYDRMFQSCPKVSHIKCLATDISATYCVNAWLNGASSTGTFIQAEGVEWPRGASGIPTGWVDVEKRTMPSGYKQVEYVSNPNYGYININRAFEANTETLEVAFVKQSSGASFVIGNPTYNYRYGSIKVIEQATALLTRVGVDYANALYKDSSIASVSANLPYTLRYAGSASGFEIYLDGVLKKTETCAWDAVNPYEDNLLSSSNTNSANTAYFHVLPVYYLKIWDGNGVLALDYVAAVRESDGVAGFYDMANNVFRKSNNANDFTAGEEI